MTTNSKSRTVLIFSGESSSTTLLYGIKDKLDVAGIVFNTGKIIPKQKIRVARSTAI